jgi:hypothetical protein
MKMKKKQRRSACLNEKHAHEWLADHVRELLLLYQVIYDKPFETGGSEMIYALMAEGLEGGLLKNMAKLEEPLRTIIANTREDMRSKR